MVEKSLPVEKMHPRQPVRMTSSYARPPPAQWKRDAVYKPILEEREGPRREAAERTRDALARMEKKEIKK